MSYTVNETTPGHFNISCNISGRPYTRSNKMGMFCDAADCACERRSLEMASFFKDFMKDMIPIEEYAEQFMSKNFKK